MGEDYDVEYWTKVLGVSMARLAATVEKVGVRIEAVRLELGMTP